MDLFSQAGTGWSTFPEERMTSLGMDVRESGTAEYANFIKQDYQRCGSVVHDLGIQIK
jgi:hypothetical protein